MMDNENNQETSGEGQTDKVETPATETPETTGEQTPPAEPVAAPAEPAPEAAPPPPPPPPPAPVADKPADTAVVAPAADPAPVVEEAPVVSSTALNPEDDEVVASLKVQLDAFARAISRTGTKEEEFRQAAKLSVQITKNVIEHPKVPVLDTLLAFFVEHLTDVCARENYMKGSTTLSQGDQQQVGVLYNLFYDIAQKHVVRINPGFVLQIVKKPEIVGYYQRKMAGIQQAAQQA